MNDSSDLEPPADLDPPADLEPRAEANSPMPFENLQAPAPIERAPEPTARWIAFAGVVVGGLLGGLIGYGTGDLLGRTPLWAAIGGLLGAVTGAIGVGIISSLTLQAMGEWKAVHHPEDERP